jgi:transcription termination factor NusB
MTELEFQTELERLAAQELDLWRNYETRKREAEQARDEAAAALLEGDSPSARRKLADASQMLTVLDGAVSLLRKRREKLLTEYFESYIAALEARKRELEAQIANLMEKRRSILDELAKIEAAEFLDPPLTKEGQVRKSYLLAQEVSNLHNRLILLRQYREPRAGVAFGDNLDTLLDNMLKTPSIVPSCDAVSNWYRTIEAHVQRGERVATWRIVWRRGALYREGCLGELEPGKWLTVNESGKVSVTYDPNHRRLADLPAPVWVRVEGPHLLGLSS